MLSPPSSSYRSNSSRRRRSSRSPFDPMSLSKRSKPSNLPDYYESQRHQHVDPCGYTSICVKQINSKISDSRVRELCDKKFSKYGSHTVKIFHKPNERVVFVNFTNATDARRARQSEAEHTWDGKEVFLEPVFYRKTIPSNTPIGPGLLHKRFIADQRSTHRSARRSPSPPINFPNHFYRQTSLQYPRPISSSSPPRSRPSRLLRRNFPSYLPLPPDLKDYIEKKPNRSHRCSPPSSDRHRPSSKQSSRQQRSRSPANRRSPSHRANSDHEPAIQQDPSRTLIVENLERNISESELEQIFSRYGTIDDICIKNSPSSSKRAAAIITFETMEMAYRARQAMDGQSVGETITNGTPFVLVFINILYISGRTGPSRHLWIGNLSKHAKRRDLEHAFSRYGPIEKFHCSFGNSSAIVTYVDVEDAIKARTKLSGAIQVTGGQIISDHCDPSTLSREGFHIDYYDRSAVVRRFISQLAQNSSNRRESRSSSKSSSHKSSSTSRSSSRSRSQSNHPEPVEQTEDIAIENVKTETHSRSPTPSIANPIKQRRSTDGSQTPSLADMSPVAGRTFHGPLGSYLSATHTADITSVNSLMVLCEQLNSSATQNNTALSTVYPVQFILKSHAYDARMHFLAGSSTLASILLGQPGDLVAAKTELRIMQRLRLEQHKLEDLEKKLRANVTAALTTASNNTNSNATNQTPNDSTSLASRKQSTLPNQTRFSILIATPKIYTQDTTAKPRLEHDTNGHIKHEKASPSHLPSNGNDEPVRIKEETIEKTTDEDEPLLSRLISYLAEKEAAGVISVPFYPTYHYDYNHSSRQETAVLHIFPPCQFTKKILKLICPSITFSDEMDENDILIDLETFNDAMVHFKEAVDGKDLERMPIIFNQLLTILKHIIETYRLIDSIDVLEYATKLIHLLQEIHSSNSTDYNPEPFSQAIDQLALCLSARITNRFILPPSPVNSDVTETNDKSTDAPNRESDVLLDILMKRNDGVDIAHDHAKYLSKYMFSLVHYVQERSVEELNHVDRTTKILNHSSLSSFLTTYRYLPGVNLMLKQLKKDNEHYSRIQSTWMVLQTHEFVGKLDSWRTYHDSVRKTVKIQWDKCYKRCQQASQAVEDARSNSKSVIHLPTSSSSSSTSSDPINTSVNLSISLPHTALQRTASSPPTIHTSPTPLTLPTTNETNLQAIVNDLELKQKELQLTKHETLTMLNKLIANTENVITESLNTYFRL
ncbi:unnamed protein product, partial [Adineta ricciae]